MRKINLAIVGGEDVSKRIPLIHELHNNNFNVTVIGSEAPDIFIENNIPFIHYNLERELSFLKDRQSLIQLKKIFKSNQFDIVQSFDTKPTILTPLALKGLRYVKNIRTITGMGRIFSDNSFKNKVLKIIYNSIQKYLKDHVHTTVFQNTDDQLYYNRHHLIHSSTSKLIRSSGIDLKNYNEVITAINSSKGSSNTVNKKEITFILVSRLILAKGVVEFLEAAKICRIKGHNFKYILVGPIEKPNYDFLKETIFKYSDFVTYLGRRKDIPLLLSKADVFVLPTFYREGVPRVLLEASASGLAIITTNTPGCNDVVIDGWNGLFVKEKDALELSNKMIEIAFNGKTLKRMKANAKDHVVNFSLINVSSAYIKEYLALLD